MKPIGIHQTKDRAPQSGTDIYPVDHQEPAKWRHICNNVIDIRKVPAFFAQGAEVFAHALRIGTNAFERPDASKRKKMRPDAEIIIQVLTAQDRLP